MVNVMRKAVVLLTGLMVLTFASQPLQAQEGLTGNFVVVVGAFSSHSNADHFVAEAKKAQLKPIVELNKFRNLYYVCVMETKDHDTAIKEATRLRDETFFKDAWVYNGTINDLATATRSEDFHPVTKEVIVPVVQAPVIEVVAAEVKPPVDSAKMREEEIKAQVGKKSMVMKKGEMERLDFIYFYRDAAVLRPESKYEVDRLVSILKQNPTQKIRIHGHTNGNDGGKIIKRSDFNSDFFSLDNTVQDYGSAKELSELRANVIKEYLIVNGIEKNRMAIKAWGGKKPLYDVDSEKAEANVRVEIEVVRNE